MIKSIKEINTEIMRLGVLRQGDQIPIVLKEWADSIVEECADSAQSTWEPDVRIKRDSILQVKEQIK